MRLNRVLGGIAASLLVSGVPAAKIPSRQDSPSSVTAIPTEIPAPAPTDSPTLAPSVPPVSSEMPISPVPTEDPQPPEPTKEPEPPQTTETPAPPEPSKTPQPPETSEDPEPPASSTTPTPPAPVETCSSHLLVDDFSKWDEGINSLEGATSGKDSSNPSHIPLNNMNAEPGNR